MLRALIVTGVLVLGCGRGDDRAVDASTDADGIDAPVDAVTSTVRVEASSVVGSLAGVKVAFLDASDAPLLVTSTGADGTATGPLAPGGSVVAVSPEDDRVYLWRGVADDVLRARFDVATTTRSVTISLPTIPGNNYHVATRCGGSNYSSTPSVVVTVPTGCTTSDMIAQRFDGPWAQAFYVPGQDLSADSIDLTASTWTATVSYDIVAVNLPAGLARLTNAVRVGDLLAEGTTLTATGTPIGTVQMSGRAVDVAGSEIVNTLLLSRVGFAQLTWFMRGPVAAVAFDANDRVVEMYATAYDASTRRMSWSQGTIGDPPDSVRATLVFSRTGSSDLTWEVSAPAGTSLTLPATLPPELAAVDPGSASAKTRQVRGYALPGGHARAGAVMFGVTHPSELLAQPGLLRISDSEIQL